MKHQLIKLQDYKKMLWKNGKGFTYEIAKDETQEEYDWRISMAEIKENGPFSNFAQYQRVISVLKGEGIKLSIDKSPEHTITPFEPFLFSGDSETYCTLIKDPVEDFNLIYKPDAFFGRFQWLDTSVPHSLCSHAQTILIFSATNELSIKHEHGTDKLAHFDSLLFTQNTNITQIDIAATPSDKKQFCCVIELIKK